LKIIRFSSVHIALHARSLFFNVLFLQKNGFYLFLFLFLFFLYYIFICIFCIQILILLFILDVVREASVPCSSAYIARKSVMQPVLEGVSTRLRNGSISWRLVTGYEEPCVPAICCDSAGDRWTDQNRTEETRSEQNRTDQKIPYHC